mmetsp:Transcript_28010/g.80963  ORF Transcript_28010/g.80963 Transcript_28010/m.80963 type:complete len:369 (-) Transcript_28010:1148-2254(-)
MLYRIQCKVSSPGISTIVDRSMKRSFALALILLASVDGFASVSVSRVAAVHRTKVAEIRKTNVEIISKDALRWAAVNVIAPALLASSVLIGDMGIACAADGAVVTSPTENYLPRRLYPGTYQNYCGPTPEVQVKGGCIAHGWYGDAPADQVDAACEQHDVAYCNCETKFLQRKRMKRVSPAQEIQQQSSDDDEESIPLLASMVALRFATRPALQVTPTIQADAEYFDCVHRADQEIIATGIRIRGEQQRAGCSTDPSLAWFCDMSGKGTLAAFEKVNLSIFLRDLDNDGDGGKDSSDIDASRWAVFRTKPSDKKSSARETLSQIEYRRENDIMRRLQSGVSVSEAASSEDVMADEEKLLSKLTAGGAY